MEMKQFARECGFKHTASSPLFPQSNGQAERAVQTSSITGAKSLDGSPERKAFEDNCAGDRSTTCPKVALTTHVVVQKGME